DQQPATNLPVEGPPRQGRRRAFRFKPNHDIALLKEAVSLQPWAAGHGKTVKRRFDTLVETARRDDLESLRASGTVEEYEERKQLLTDVRMLLDDFLA
ncbi:TPA: hypothetical protein N0F65_012964, partial [Lagenidium giganteum]